MAVLMKPPWNMREQLSIAARLLRGLRVACLLLLCAGAHAADISPVDIAPGANQVDLSKAAYLREDPQGTLTIDDVRKPENAGRFKLGSPGVGMSTSAHWMRFSVRFGADSHNRWWFDTGNRTLQEVALYWPGEDGRYQHLETGSTRRFGERPLATNTFTFPLTLPATGNAEIYLRVRSTGYMGIAVLPTLWSPEAYRISEKSESMLWIFMLGLAIATAAINLMLAFYNRDLNNLFYVLSILSFANGMCFAVGGIGSAYEMFIPNSPVLYQMTWIGSVGLTGVFPNIFLVRLLNLNKTFRGFKPLNIAFVSMYVAWTTLQVSLTALQRPEWAGFMQLSWAIGAFIYTLPLILLVVAISRELKRGNRSARYVFVAFTPLLFVLCYAAAYTFVYGKMPWGLILSAALFEWYVTAAAVADKYNQVRLERAHAKQALLESLQESEQRLEAKVTLRTAELADEKQRTQDLLHNMLPVEIARELSTTGTTTPVRHEEASVLFTDFNGFTQAASTMPAGRMVAELNEVFAAFDDICDEEGIEKIKTIGDAYMAAAGLPKPCADHAQRCVRAGLRMAAFVEQRNADSAFKWRLRVGVHSGPVIAGVVGKRKYAFDIWGDTVNIASRMESSGEPGKVNVSAYTYDLIRKDFTCEYRGRVDAKGKGEVDMYFVVGASHR